MQEARFTDPALLLDDNSVHQRNLPGRAPEAQGSDPSPHQQRLAKGNAMRWATVGSLDCDTICQGFNPSGSV